ncbi:MAG: hypothetical protein OXQ28_12080, partial [Acidobacteriota bacterium]|nr:hypothetical protein [Acidobacteriota bacterium]
WVLPPSLLTFLSAFGGSLPRTSLAYENLGALSQRGVEFWAEQRIGSSASLWGNYSWQARPGVPGGEAAYPLTQLNLPPTHRLNVGASLNGRRFLGDLAVHRATSAFWSDVLTPDYHGYSPAYTLVNASAGLKWRDGRVTTLVRVTNLLNRTVQQHIFGDLLRRSVVGELRLALP